ncbi:MAG: FHA domain-containing protein [Chloroflexota bacterium]
MKETAWLIDLTPETQARWPIEKPSYVIGRHAPADLILPLSRISRQHARIERDERGYLLIDLESRNGTFVNGQPLGTIAHRLNNGDQLVFGGVVTLQFQDPSETAHGPRIGRLNGIWIDPDTEAVWIDGRQVGPPLSLAQLTLLKLLYLQADQIVSRETIIATVWPDVDPSGVSTEAVDGLIKRLRQRLRQTQPEQTYVQVIRGHGLKLAQPQI